MKNKFIVYLFLVLSIFIISGCELNDNKNDNTSEVKNTMKAIINEQEYTINLEDNETVTSLLNKLPLEVQMTELNGNEKYVYLDYDLPTNSSSQKRIYAGDIMLYGNNCLVIFYKSFNTSYSYTKIGHIDKLPNLGSGSINVKFIKNI